VVGALDQIFGAFEQIFDSNQQIPHGGGSDKEAESATDGATNWRRAMKRILLAAAAVLAVTAAQAETIIYVTPGSAVQYVAPQAFKTVFNGNEKLLQVSGGATNRDLIVVAKAPEDTIIDSAHVLVIDGNGKVVDTVRVVVSPLRPQPEEDIRTVEVLGAGGSITYLCIDNQPCINASAKKGTGDADVVTKTTYKDGSTSTWKHQSTPPTPPTP
jgi:hypothetical protein